MRTGSEIEALKEDDASVNEEHTDNDASANEELVDEERNARKPSIKRQRSDNQTRLELLIINDIEEHGYKHNGYIVKEDTSIIRTYVKESEETYKYVVSEIFLHVKGGNYPGIIWTKETKNIPDALPRLSIEQAVNSKFQRVISPAKWKKLKKQCIYNP